MRRPPLSTLLRSQDTRFLCSIFGRGQRVAQWQRRPLSSRSSSTTTDADAAQVAAKLAKAPAQVIPPRPMFPWRHDTTMENPLPRLKPGTEEFLNDTILPRNGQAFVASMFLNVPVVLAALSSQWRDDLAEASSWAFARGVSGIISNVYKLPYDQVSVVSEEEDDDAKVDFTYEPTDEAPSTITAEAEEEKKGDDNFCPEVESMLSRPLRELYQSAHESGKEQLKIRLQVKPVTSFLYSVFCVPFVTRQSAESDPRALKHMQNTLQSARTSPVEAYQSIQEFLMEQVVKDDKVSTTVEIQVVVQCQEIFQVFDKTTGVLLQGSEDGQVREVYHLVRLETTVETLYATEFPYLPSTRQGNWQITDIDDLVSPKSWYQQ